jgi:hypothetical protein
MKVLKYLALLFSITALNAHAETIDVGLGGYASWSIPSTSVGQACNKIVFISRNTGTLQTGLTSSSLKFISGKKRIPSTTNPASFTTSTATVAYSLTATTQAGVYTLCLTPQAFLWSNLPGSNYNFSFIVNGVATADHGVFEVSLSSY